ncbi:related to capsular associated protein [Cephalotrichum gorgonifer]|uniref:Related to capsular associated protein n=1 Tax=Cephalotrichum gorgonifer TaxID=2041049 RepID=A0AAE8MZR2_9PEZI|nr:related to capsular associated protein [Cephalotrichum gorgonifer]
MAAWFRAHSLGFLGDGIRSESAAGAILTLSLCAVSIYARLSLTFERYALLDEPRGTAVAAVAVATSLVWLASGLASPARPGSIAHWVISLCLFLRVEIFLAVSRETQCSSPGIEALLCIPLVIYEIFFSPKVEEHAEDTSDPWGSVLVDVVTWCSTSTTCLIASVVALSLGAYSAIAQTSRTTYFCSSVYDHAARDLGLQWLGMCLDAIAAILLWRVLYWTNSTKARLHTLSSILNNSLAANSLIFFASVLFAHSNPRFVRVSDALTDGVLLAVLLTASSLLMCESTPITPLSIITATYGKVASLQNVDRMKTFLHGTTSSAVNPLWALWFGFSLILSRTHLHMLSTGFRTFLFFTMTATLFACLPISLLRAGDHQMAYHPLNKLIYESRVSSDRWLMRASISTTLRLAVSEYRERNGGRDPPPKFNAWFEFAMSRNSAIVDHFGQIGDDILPFWELSPQTIRSRVELLAGQPDVGMVRVRSGAASTEGGNNEGNKKDLGGLVSIISAFSQHLPDMDIPVNLLHHPRVLPAHVGTSGPWTATSVLERREMEALACPAGSATRARQVFQIRDLSVDSSKPYSKGQFVAGWQKSLDTCRQPDVPYLHGFHMTTPSSHKPFTQLMPLFGRTKTGGYADILVPFPGDDEPSSSLPFDSKTNALYWRGGYGDLAAADQALRGNHKHRLVHLFNNASTSDETVVVLPAQGGKFVNARVTTIQLDELLPINVGFTTDPTLHSCSSPTACDPALQEFGASEPDKDPLSHRYLLLLDTDSGPASSPGVPTALRSSSVPFVSTIFTEWFTERIQPWVHFVPVDVRYMGLHSTLAYFMGLGGDEGVGGDEGEGGKSVTLAGRELVMNGDTEDARWIASQGKAWAEKALRREDMEVYLFRLLLEWARVVDDKRDELAFVYEGE